MATGAKQEKTDIRQFKKVVANYTLEGACGRKFIRVGSLKRWLRQGDRVGDLLEEAYKGLPDPALPVEPKNIVRGDSLLIFSILLDLGHGGLVHSFCKRDFVLPLKQLDIQDTYKQALREDSPHINLDGQTAEDLTKLFDRRQWAFCPASFRHFHTGSYAEDRVLPIRMGDKIRVNTKGGTASVWQVIILDEFLEDELKKAISESRFQSKNDNLGDRYQLAIKSFNSDKCSFFDTEVKAFQALKNHTGMVRFFGHFDHKVKGGKNTYHILLEYGQLDLDEYFFTRDVLPPKLPTDVECFWTDMRNIAGAVKDVHLFKGPRQRDDVSEYYGWHADIKPDNILRVNKAFKLADPGFATFKKIERKNELNRRVQLTAQEENDLTMIKGGTATYGAPECNYGKMSRDPVTRAIDIWSLGCVFSVAATWAVLGPGAVQQYHTIRQHAIANLVEQQQNQQTQQRSGQKQEETSTLINSDCFHDGAKALGIVAEWHKLLRKAAGGTDFVTSEVLDLIDDSMLLAEPEKRIRATDLCTRMDDILRTAQMKCRGLVSERLLSALADLDIKAPALPTQQELLQNDNATNLLSPDIGLREQRKSKLFPRIASTTHKSIAKDNSLLMPRDVPPIPTLPATSSPSLAVTAIPELTVTGTTEESIKQIPKTPLPPRADASGGGNNYLQREETPPRPLMRAETSSGHNITFPHIRKVSTLPKQSPWAARAELDTLPSTGFMRSKFGLKKKLKKDPVLAQHFGNRDLHFFVDNTISMADKWDEVSWLLEVLIGKSAGLDEDGMDLTFSNGEHNVRGKDSIKDFTSKMAAARPQKNRKVDTEITMRLGLILDEYCNKIQDRPRARDRKLTIVILTDGIWEGLADKNAIEKLIAHNYQKMDKILDGKWPDTRQLTFQFIQFGHDVEATYHLQSLDDLMQYQYPIPDIIDTVDSRSDVYKMLLGSFVPEYDEDQDDGPWHISRMHSGIIAT